MRGQQIWWLAQHHKLKSKNREVEEVEKEE
jgi:hypothetical protein